MAIVKIVLVVFVLVKKGHLTPGPKKKLGKSKAGTKGPSASLPQIESPRKKLKPKESPLQSKKNDANPIKRKSKPVKEESESSASKVKKSCLLHKETQEATEGKASKHVTFERCVDNSAQDSSPSKILSIEDEKDSSLNTIHGNCMHTNIVVDSSASDKAQDSLSNKAQDSLSNKAQDSLSNIALQEDLNDSSLNTFPENCMHTNIVVDSSALDKAQDSLSNKAQDSLSNIASQEDVNDSSLITFPENGTHSNTVASDDSQSGATPDQTSELAANHHDPIRGHRPGKKPMYRGHADWSREFQPVGQPKFKHTFSADTNGLYPRLCLDSEPETNVRHGVEKQSGSEPENVGSKESFSPALLSESVRTRLASTQPRLVVSRSDPLAEGSGSTALAGARNPAVAAIASTTSSDNPASLDSEEAEVGSALDISELRTTSKALAAITDPPASKIYVNDNSTATVKTLAAAALAQKLRNAFASRGTQPQKTKFHEDPTSLQIPTEDAPKPNTLVLPQPKQNSVTVRRIIVNDYSSSPSTLGKKGLPCRGTKIQTVIVRRLPSHPPSVVSDSNSACIKSQAGSDLQRDPAPGESEVKDRPYSDSDRMPDHFKGGEGLSSGAKSNTVRQSALKRVKKENCGNIFDNVFEPSEPPTLQRIELESTHFTGHSTQADSEVDRAVPVLKMYQADGMEEQESLPKHYDNGVTVNNKEQSSHLSHGVNYSKQSSQLSDYVHNSEQGSNLSNCVNDNEQNSHLLNGHSNKYDTQNNNPRSQSVAEGQHFEHSGALQHHDHLSDSDPQHTAGNQQHTAGNQHHTAGNQQHTAGNQQHTAGNQQHTAGNQQHTAGNQQHTHPPDVAGLDQGAVLVASPRGDYEPVVFDHPYCQASDDDLTS
ncbi:hypothetical protein EGW08_012703 [Elysia chlorotica]|uniref:Uncharacterized protein n=1 Tax=Elysia chlorotica TaxID=188477 RepID=A0A3S1BAG2_ELYCH|nr:hypothetical protein EGW08_012703 [Elysia chlorotica]